MRAAGGASTGACGPSASSSGICAPPTTPPDLRWAVRQSYAFNSPPTASPGRHPLLPDPPHTCGERISDPQRARAIKAASWVTTTAADVVCRPPPASLPPSMLVHPADVAPFGGADPAFAAATPAEGSWQEGAAPPFRRPPSPPQPVPRPRTSSQPPGHAEPPAWEDALQVAASPASSDTEQFLDCCSEREPGYSLFCLLGSAACRMPAFCLHLLLSASRCSRSCPCAACRLQP